MKKELKIDYRTSESFKAKGGEEVPYEGIFKGINRNAKNSLNGRKNTLSTEDTEDWAQDAALKAVRLHRSFDTAKSVNTLAFGNRIAERCKADAGRSASKRPTAFSRLEREDEDGSTYLPAEIEGWQSDEYAADSALEARERKEFVQKAKDTLSESYREMIDLTLDGYSSGEIAEMLGITPNAAYVRMCRALKAMKAALIRLGYHA